MKEVLQKNLSHTKVCTISATIAMFLAQSCQAITLNCDIVTQKAIDNSFELKIARIDQNISKADIKGAKSQYFPTLKLQGNVEYGHSLGENSNNSFASVGNTVLSNNTRYQDLISLGVNYTAFDFGIRGKKLLIAKKTLSQKDLEYTRNLRELKLQVLDTYTNLLLSYKESQIRQQMLPIYEDMFEAKERLFKAGKSSKLDVMDEAINIAQTRSKIAELNTKLANYLTELTKYTAEVYNIDSTAVQDFHDENWDAGYVPVSDIKSSENKNSNIQNTSDIKNVTVLKDRVEKTAKFKLQPVIDVTKTPEYKEYQLEIQKKQAEIAILSRQRLPQLYFYTNYSLYGQDYDSFFSSMKDVGPKNLSIGVSTQINLFDGFKNNADREKAHWEMQKLKLQRDNSALELQSRYQKIYHSFESYQDELEIKQALLDNVRSKLSALHRLNAQKLTEKTDILRQQVELLSQQVELETNIINNISQIKQMKILSEGLN